MNFQNVPRKDKVVKRAFVPKLDALLFFDYSQIEFVFLGYFCAKLGDSSIVDALNSGQDLHTESAASALGLPPEEVAADDNLRQVGKTMNYSLIYGGGRPTITRQLGVDWFQAGRLLDGFHRRWPGVALVSARINDTLDTRGYIKTPWGRHLHPRSRHSALNTLIQGSAADLMRSSLVNVHQWLTELELKSHLVLTVHDELIIDADFPEIPVLLDGDTSGNTVSRLMDYAPVSEFIQIETDCEWTTTNWAEKTAYDG